MNIREAFPRDDHSGSSSNTPIEDILARLAGDTQALCKHLLPNGHREGQEWRCGSINGEPGKSLGVHLAGAKMGVWSDFAAGDSGDILDLIQACLDFDKAQAVRWAKDWLRIDGNTASPSRGAPRPPSTRSHHADDDKERTLKARAIWEASQPAPGTPAESYLKYRGIAIPVPAIIRYNPAVKYTPSNLYLPCMIAAVQAPDRSITAIHRTFIRDDGRGRAAVNKPRMAFGPIGAGAVRLGPAQVALGLAEGIETALSAMQLFEIPLWAAIGSRMDRVALPDQVTEVQLFGDNGDPGHEAAEKAAKTFTDQGRRVVMHYPPAEFGDWNDALCAFLKEKN